MEVTSTIALISINATLVTQLVSFLIFLFLFNRIMFRPLRDVMEKRENWIATIKQEIEAARFEMERTVNALAKEEIRIKAEAFAAQRQLEDDGNHVAEEMFKTAQTEIDRLRAQSQTEIESQVQSVRQYLAQESQKLSITIMEKALNRRLAYE
jgi:F-type H+-transporting ATPase subunit b